MPRKRPAVARTSRLRSGPRAPEPGAGTRYAVLLRAVNLGGGTQVGMDRFRAMLEGLGGTEVRTLLQSGNAIVRSGSLTAAELELRVEAGVQAAFGRPIPTFVRAATDFTAIRADNPFPDEARTDPSHLVVAFLKGTPRADAWDRLRSAVVGRERTGGRGREAYIVYPDGIGTSQLTSLRIERALGVVGTARNWNTVGRIAAALDESRGADGPGDSAP